MPLAAKSSTSAKKSGPPKAKGAARAKSGCYTCRIRRKKCDEQKSDRGSCKTCDRLRLECLGYGVKRPDWLRESGTVDDIRERIKAFLASQGMIKGQSGPSSRDAHQEQFLILRPGYDHRNSPDTESSTISVSFRSLSPPLLYPVSPGSPAEETWEHYPPFPFSSSQYHEVPFLQAPRPSIEITYEEIWPGDDQLQDAFTQMPRITYLVPPTMYTTHHTAADYYGAYVFDVQYPLANRPPIRQIVIDSLQSHAASTEIVKILSDLHFHRKRLPQRMEGIPTILHYLKCTGTGTLDDAMAVLHSVSAYLFNGGEGAWDDCIDFAANHVRIVLGTTFFDTLNPLLFCDLKTAFIVKTAIWFDVLASITDRKSVV